MRGSVHRLAAVMSLLMVSTSISGSVCEWCCGLDDAAGQCHADRAGMNCGGGCCAKMGHEPAGRVTARNAYRHGFAAHCASREMGTAAPATALAGKCESGMSQPCETSPPCGSRGCTRFLASKSSPAPVASGFVQLAPIAIMIPRHGKLQAGFLRMEVGPSPPGALPSERPTGVLRI